MDVGSRVFIQAGGGSGDWSLGQWREIGEGVTTRYRRELGGWRGLLVDGKATGVGIQVVTTQGRSWNCFWGALILPVSTLSSVLWGAKGIEY